MSTPLFNFAGIPEVSSLTWILALGIFCVDLILAEDLLESRWPLSFASTLPFGDHSDIAFCRLNEKKGFRQVVQVMLCVYLQCGIWKCIWKLPDSEFFGIVYSLYASLSNSFKLSADRKANHVPVSLGFLLNIFPKSEIKWDI